MVDINKKSTLLVMDYINDIVDRKGKLAGKGYPDYMERNNTIENLQEIISKSRENQIPIVYIRVAFDKNYTNHPKNSPLFGKAQEFGALCNNSFGTQFYEPIKPNESDYVLTKTRVSPFFGTNLDSLLRNLNTENVLLAGVATDLVVSSAARDSHDRGYNTYVIQDACAAANENDHNNAIETMKKISYVYNVSDINFK